MSIKWIGSAFVCMAFAFGCGGGESGLDESLALADLLPAEIDEVCASVEPREVDCGDIILEFSVEACVDNLGEVPDTCDATVGDQLDCNAAIEALSDDEICDPELPIPAECDAVFDDTCVPE